MSYTKTEQYIIENFRRMTDEEVLSHKLKWGFLSCQWRNKLPNDFIRRFKDNLNFHQLSYGNMAPQLIEDLKDYWDYHVLLCTSKAVTDSIIEFALKHNIESGQFWRYIPYDKIDKYMAELKNLKPRNTNMRWCLAIRRDITEKIVNELLIHDESSVHEITRENNCYRYRYLSEEYINKLKLINKFRK